MIIAIDYDETWSRDPEFWADVSRFAVTKGHRVIGVTARDASDCEDMCRHYKNLEVFCTGGKAKRKFCFDKGVSVDVWIDDSPEFVGDAMTIDFDDVPEPGRTW